MEDEKAQTLGPRRQQLRRQRQPLQRGQHVVRQDRQSQLGGIGAKSPARQSSGRQFVFQHMVDRFDSPGFFPMSLQQFRRPPFPNIRHHCKVLHRAPVGEQLLLPPADPHRHITERLRVLVLITIAGAERHLGTLADDLGQKQGAEAGGRSRDRPEFG